jgi:O-antigen/teichoic acid export membrane protein
MQALVAKYHQGAQLVSVFLIPSALAMALFSEAILMLWTGNAGLSKNVAPLLTLLAVGTMLNGLMHIPYMLQLAHGWSGFAVRLNVVAVTLLIPAILWAVPRYGAIGAAWAWLALNTGYVIIGIHFMHQKLLPREKWHWYGKDVLLPLTGAATVLLTSKVFFPDLTKPVAVAWIGITMLLAVGISFLAASLLRANVLRTTLRVTRTENK